MKSTDRFTLVNDEIDGSTVGRPGLRGYEVCKDLSGGILAEAGLAEIKGLVAPLQETTNDRKSRGYTASWGS